MTTESVFEKIWTLIESSESVVISSHVRIDGDALGSTLALYAALTAMGKTVRMVHVDSVPKQLRYLADWDLVRTPGEVPETEQYDLGIVLDSSFLDRLEDSELIVRRAKSLINIDHHRSWDDFGDVNLADPSASAVGEIMCMLFEKVGADVTSDMATALYTAIATDTGGFRYANTTARTHEVAAMLLERGADTDIVNRHLYDNRPLVELKLLSPALATLDQQCDGKITWMSVDAKMIRDAGATLEHLEGFVNYPRSVNGTVVAILFTEIEAGVTKASLRSEDEADVSEIASRFGGGGHSRAAGCTIEKPLDEARKMMLAVCRQTLGCKTDE